MKKTLVLILAVVLLLSACSGTKVTASAKAVSLAKQAVEALDGYLDGSMSYNEAHDVVDEASRKMEYTSNYTGTDMTDEQRADWYIHMNLVHAASALTFDNYEGTPERFNDVVDARNKIAEYAGLGKR